MLFPLPRFAHAACLLALASLAAMPARASLLDDLPAGTGYAAWELCTRVVAAGDELARVRDAYTAPKVRPLPLVWRVDVSAQGAAVQTVLPFLQHRRVAVYRPGLGCTLVPPCATEAGVRAQPFHPAVLPPPADRPWPDGEAAGVESGHLTTAQAAALERDAQALFTEPADDPRHRLQTVSLLVAQGGHLVYERYAAGVQRSQPQLGWSMTKTLTALIAGLLHHDGRLALDAPVGLPQWAGTPKAAITWRQLLNMAPGLRWDEGYGGDSDVTRMLFSQADEGAWAADQPLVAAPGTVFTYSTGSSTVAMLRMRQLLGGTHQAVYDYYQGRLFAPLGIRGGVIEPDASGTPSGGARGLLRPVDWLRLGQLVANGGRWGGQALISPDYMAFMSAASPASAEYGGSIWRQPSTQIPAALRERLPQDLVWFAGHMGQFLVVVPSRNLVVLRTGVAFDKDRSRELTFQLVADLLQAR